MKTGSVVTSGSRTAGGLYESVRGLHQALYELPDTTVEVLTVANEFDGDDLPAWSPVKVITHKRVGPRFFSYAPALKSALLASDFDILHAHGIWQYPSAAAAHWHARTGKPYLVSPHGMLDPWAVRNSAWKKQLALAFYERRNLEGAACFRALCESEVTAICALGLRKSVAIIPNGIDLPVEARAAGTSNDGWRAGRKVLLYLGRIHPKKGLVNLLKDWALTLKSQSSTSNWLLAIAGWDQGGHETELKRLATELSLRWASAKSEPSSSLRLPPSVIFLGPQFGEAKASCYRNCDAVILPSFSEGLPMVVLEAWAYGKAVLMTPECNLPEGFAAGAALRIGPKGTGDVQNGSRQKEHAVRIPAGLAELFAMNDAARLAMGARGRALVAERFAWPKIAREMRAVYEWVLGGGQKPGSVVTGS